MHELSIVSGMMDQIEKIKSEQSWKAVTRVQMVLGVLSGVERHAIEACFELLTNEWKFKPLLDIVIDPIEFHCSQCDKVTLLKNVELVCSQCKSIEGQMQGGRSLYFSEMEGE